MTTHKDDAEEKHKNNWLERLESEWEFVRSAALTFSSQETVSELAGALISKEYAECKRALLKVWDDAPNEEWVQQEPGFIAICDLLNNGAME